ncbi:hypothetical protein GGX14DRAFT_391161 [Mycena pura]|uniref:Uncharacterized protein n=1 Tax=Mycena pura TaxID=153505 RepID=A0AAD6VM54_9AGAR|nr:hypothetical protein GGX14DRAFT_391161 [Mycena pura]
MSAGDSNYMSDSGSDSNFPVRSRTRPRTRHLQPTSDESDAEAPGQGHQHYSKPMARTIMDSVAFLMFKTQQSKLAEARQEAKALHDASRKLDKEHKSQETLLRALKANQSDAIKVHAVFTMLAEVEMEEIQKQIEEIMTLQKIEDLKRKDTFRLLTADFPRFGFVMSDFGTACLPPLITTRHQPPHPPYHIFGSQPEITRRPAHSTPQYCGHTPKFPPALPTGQEFAQERVWVTKRATKRAGKHHYTVPRKGIRSVWVWNGIRAAERPEVCVLGGGSAAGSRKSSKE